MTDVPLKEYLETRLKSVEERLSLQFQLNEVALQKADATMSARLNSMNEFREALKDQASKMATRVELGALNEQVQELRRDKANLDGRLAVIAASISLGVSAVMWIAFHLVFHV